MSIHTPGPWKSYLTPYQAQRQIRDEAEEIVIAVVPNKGNTARCDADARLIAAAPEMREALQAYLNRADRIGLEPGCFTRAEIAEIEDIRVLLARIDG